MHLVTTAAVIWFCLGTAANAESIGLGIEPIVGYEQVHKLLPTEHNVTRMLYGGRMTLGILLIAAEIEYTQAKDDEQITSPAAILIRDKTDRGRVGLRSGMGLGQLLRLIGRAGVQGKKNVHDEIAGGVTTRTKSPLEYAPYAGAILTGGIGYRFTVSGGVTVAFNDFPNMKANDYEVTLGFGVRLP